MLDCSILIFNINIKVIKMANIYWAYKFTDILMFGEKSEAILNQNLNSTRCKNYLICL